LTHNLGTDVTVGGIKLTHLDVDPWLISAGVGFRF
jgi:outer membrane protein W